MRTGLAFALVLVTVGMAGCSPKSATATGAVEPTAAASDVTFAGNVKGIIDQRCAKCHVEQRKGKLSLASLESAMTGGKSGAVVKPGDSEGSLLYKMISGQPGVDRMPPKGDMLSDEQRATFKAWIDGGAK